MAVTQSTREVARASASGQMALPPPSPRKVRQDWTACNLPRCSCRATTVCLRLGHCWLRSAATVAATAMPWLQRGPALATAATTMGASAPARTSVAMAQRTRRHHVHNTTEPWRPTTTASNRLRPQYNRNPPRPQMAACGGQMQLALRLAVYRRSAARTVAIPLHSGLPRHRQLALASTAAPVQRMAA